MRYLFTVIFGKLTLALTQCLQLGAGGTWPGEIALTLYPNILQDFSRKLKKGVIIVAGTNGKTTTSLMITQILLQTGQQVIHNATGANLKNGVISAFIAAADWTGSVHADWAVLEVDENSLPLVLHDISSTNIAIVILNLFRDQLDRYGEVDVIAEKWQKALRVLPENSTVILNADDPQVVSLGIIPPSLFPDKERRIKTIYFGIEDRSNFLKYKEHARDSIFCINCGSRLIYEGIYFSHLGIWKCDACGEKRPKPDITHWDSPLPGLYNTYNTLAAVSVAKALKISGNDITKSLQKFTPAFGRQEEFEIKGKKVKLFLSKNPAGFNVSLRTVIDLKPSAILFVLNDRIPDGCDVSWIWDVDFEIIPESVEIIVSGDRTYDLGIRIKYARDSSQFTVRSKQKVMLVKNNDGKKLIVEPELKRALNKGLDTLNDEETLYVLPTYSAMLEVRKVLKGRKIL